MNKTEIKNLLSTDKNILLEFIGEFSRPQLAKKIVGFANTDGGTIIIDHKDNFSTMRNYLILARHSDGKKR